MLPGEEQQPTLITVALSTTIGSPRERVYRALMDPAERPAWDDRVLGEVSLPRRGGQPARARRRVPRDDARSDSQGGAPEHTQAEVLRESRWRFKLSSVPLILKEQLLESAGQDRLVTRISIGSMRFKQILTLHAEDDETGPHTRLGMKVVAENRVALIGETVSRLEVQKIVIEYVDSTLRQVQKHCEADA